MTQFRTRYIYLVVIGRIISSIFFAAFSLLLLYLIFESFRSQKQKPIEMVFALLFTMIMMYLPYHFLSILFKQSYIFSLDEKTLTKKSIFSRKKQIYNFYQIKGFSTSDYPLKIWDFKSIIIYLNSGEKYELPQFLYFNFKCIENQLISNSIKKLGHENYKWKFFDSRYYKYDN